VKYSSGELAASGDHAWRSRQVEAPLVTPRSRTSGRQDDANGDDPPLDRVLELQRMVGNRAVTGLLTGSAPPVQREDAGSASGTRPGSGRATGAGAAVSLSHAAAFEGQVLADKPGWRRYKGECATGVQYVFYAAGTPLGRTSTWKQGIKVRGNKVPAGTAIASFRNGRFAQDHAAIFVRETAEGLEVWDQFNHPSKPWGMRVLRFSKDNDRSNNGNLFYVIEH
jgi:hypothetical protein